MYSRILGIPTFFNRFHFMLNMWPPCMKCGFKEDHANEVKKGWKYVLATSLMIERIASKINSNRWQELHVRLLTPKTVIEPAPTCSNLEQLSSVVLLRDRFSTGLWRKVVHDFEANHSRHHVKKSAFMSLPKYHIWNKLQIIGTNFFNITNVRLTSLLEHIIFLHWILTSFANATLLKSLFARVHRDTIENSIVKCSFISLRFLISLTKDSKDFLLLKIPKKVRRVAKYFCVGMPLRKPLPPISNAQLQSWIKNSTYPNLQF